MRAAMLPEQPIGPVFVGLKTAERNITQCVGGPCRPGRDRCLWDTPTDKARYAFHLADATCGINDPNVSPPTSSVSGSLADTICL